MKLYTALLATGIAAAAMSISASTPDLPSCDVWQLACHYTSSNRESTYDINRVIIHKTEGGTAAGASSWFANCDSAGSAHYVFDKANGYCYQCVYEKDVAWQAGYSSTNNNGIGIEHSGWTANNDTTNACYDESAVETKSCVTYYAVPANRSYIIGHSEVPGCPSGNGGGTGCHTDPGQYWNWTYYMGKITGSTPETIVVDNSNGGFSASANWSTGSSATDKYGADYRFRSTAAISDKANWAFTPAQSGSFQLSAWWAAGSNRSATAPYYLTDNTVVNANQQANGGKWNLLGTKSLTGGTGYAMGLSCWTTTGYVVVADAIKAYKP